MEILRTERYETFSRMVRIDDYECEGIIITEVTNIPRHWGKEIRSWVTVDLQLPIGSYDCLNEDYYVQKGYGIPVFDTLEEAIAFIREYKHGIPDCVVSAFESNLEMGERR